MMSRRAGGFTLLEVMVALAIFAVMAAIAYSGLDAMARTRSALADSDQRLRDVGLAVHRLERELRQVVPRSVRDAYGAELAAMEGTPARIEFTRGGVRHAPGLNAPSLQRVAWGHEARQLLQMRWFALDRAPASGQQVLESLDGVLGLRLSYRDAGGVWRDRWPPPAGGDPSPLPRAVDIRIQLEDMGEVRRLVVFPESAGVQP